MPQGLRVVSGEETSLVVLEDQDDLGPGWASAVTRRDDARDKLNTDTVLCRRSTPQWVGLGIRLCRPSSGCAEVPRQTDGGVQATCLPCGGPVTLASLGTVVNR